MRLYEVYGLVWVVDEAGEVVQACSSQGQPVTTPDLLTAFRIGRRLFGNPDSDVVMIDEYVSEGGAGRRWVLAWFDLADLPSTLLDWLLPGTGVCEELSRRAAPDCQPTAIVGG